MQVFQTSAYTLTLNNARQTLAPLNTATVTGTHQLKPVSARIIANPRHRVTSLLPRRDDTDAPAEGARPEEGQDIAVL